MAIDSVDMFLAILQRMQVLAPQEVQDITRELGSHFSDPYDLARYLVEIEWLTAYQVHLLFNDRWEELTIGHYVVLDRLGEGGVSEVFKAWDTANGRIVALKVLHPHLPNRPAAVRELQAEREAVTRLSHPNIIRIFDANQVRDVSYFAMEFVEGLDLERYVRRTGRLEITEACEYIRQVALGLQHAHQLGLVHRDIKPANLFLAIPGGFGDCETSPVRRHPEAVVKILDWGLARVRPDAGGVSDFADVDLDAETGDLIGTADYVAPELANDPCLADVRSDVYSLGCTLYFLLSAQQPFRGNSLMQKLLQHQEAERPHLRNLRADIPEELDAVVQRMMARSPDERYAIPLLAAAALRPFSAAATSRPGSSASIVRLKKPSTAIIDTSAFRGSSSDS